MSDIQIVFGYLITASFSVQCDFHNAKWDCFFPEINSAKTKTVKSSLSPVKSCTGISILPSTETDVYPDVHTF